MSTTSAEQPHNFSATPTQGGNPTAQPEIPPGTERDEEMRSERGAQSDSEEVETPAMKRKRTEQDEYTVSKPGPSYRDKSPLRKLPPQCTWDKDARATPTPAPPAEFSEWIRLYAGKRPFNPEYDEAIYARVPTYRYANPHFWKTQRGTPEEMPLDGHDAFTPGPFPHTHISDWRHLGNIQDQQKEMLLANHEQILALVPHGGGRTYSKQGATLAKIYKQFFRSIRFAGYDGDGCNIKVIPPDVKHEGGPNSTNPFAQPWDFYVELEDDTALLMRMFLLWQEHFAVDQSRSFSIYPLVTENPPSWKLLVLICPHMELATTSHNDVLDKRRATLTIVKAKLKSYSPYRDEIATLAATKIGHTGSRDQVFKTITDSFHLEPASVDTRNGPQAAFALLARPLTSVVAEMKMLKRAMVEALCGPGRGDHFYISKRFTRL